MNVENEWFPEYKGKFNLLLVKTKLKETESCGVGLFADEFIPKGKVWWRFHEGIDLIISNAEIDNHCMSARFRWFVEKYAVENRDGLWLLSVDDGRFANHSSDSNTVFKDHACIAKRDINRGDELTNNYREYIYSYPDGKLEFE